MRLRSLSDCTGQCSAELFEVGRFTPPDCNKITIRKVVDNGFQSPSPYTFSFECNDDQGITLFELTPPNTPEIVFEHLEAGEYDIMETDPGPDYMLTNVTCEGESASWEWGRSHTLRLTLERNDSITCTFENTLVALVPTMTHGGVIIAAVLIGGLSMSAIRRKRRSAR
ncbi:MAG: hypothetical protein JRJ60_21225 [Deltaproteobacteria bacterium]|nr:hypothetical protein [Deltaproteobacteria bacterium]